MAQEMTIPQALDAALRHHNAGELRQAEHLYRQVLSHEPGNHNALHLLGILAYQSGHPTDAAALISQAASVNPNPEYFANLGNVLHELSRFDEAITACSRAITLDPNSATGHNNLGYALQGAGRPDEAIAAFKVAAKLKPDWFLPLRNLAIAYRELDLIPEAVAAYGAAHALTPNDPVSCNDYGVVLQANHQLDEAEAVFRAGIALASDIPEIHNNLGNALQDSGRIEEAIEEFRRAIRLRPDFSVAHSNLLYAMHFDPACEPAKLLEAHRDWARLHAEALSLAAPPPAPTQNSRIRIGFVSSDLHNHPIGRFLLPILESFDREQFEIVCYYSGHAKDAVNAKLRSASDAWHDAANLNDAQLADLIRSHGVDVLFDLACHAPFNRLLVFARRPAAVQITYLGYPGTTGMSAMDFRITDPTLDPPGDESEAFYSERSLRPASNYWCYRAIDDTPDVGPLPAERNGYVTFGCLNHFSKVNPPLLETWCRLMREVPDSQLILHALAGSSRERALATMASHGVDASRVEFVCSQPMPQYLDTYNRIDVGLDPFPYNGGTTTCDALWTGVPVVTLAGTLAVHRAGASILSNVGLPELITQNADDYVRVARELAEDRPRLREIRANLREKMRASPLCDAATFTRGLEESLCRVAKRT
jgi:predicted O-linked N-acetylglucosamine transferase (SPINDLY family)